MDPVVAMIQANFSQRLQNVTSFVAGERTGSSFALLKVIIPFKINKFDYIVEYVHSFVLFAAYNGRSR